MRSVLFKTVMAVVLTAAIFGSATIALAQTEAQPDQVLVDINLKDADMLAATKILTAQTGLQFMFEPGNDPFGRVTLTLHNKTAEEAIGYICKAAGASFRKDENGVYIIGHKKTDGSADAPPIAPPVPPVPSHLHKFKLMHADAQHVFARLTGHQVDDFDSFMEMNRFSAITDGAKRSGFNKPEIYMIGNTPSGTAFQPVSTQNYSAPRTFSESGSNITLPGESAGQFGGGQGGGFGGGGLGGEGGGGGLGGKGGG